VRHCETLRKTGLDKKLGGLYMPTPIDILRPLTHSLEREAEFTDKIVKTNIQYCDQLAKATVMQMIEGKWIMFEVLVRPIGSSEPLRID
jgi:hypothetical protein